MDFQRANTSEQKEERLRQIKAAALALYGATPFEKITLASIAKCLSFTRANLYKYCGTKEEIYLLILTDEVRLWADDVFGTFEDAKDISIAQFAPAWAAVAARHMLFVELFAIMNTALGKNVSAEVLARSKKGMYTCFSAMYGFLAQRLHGFDAEQIRTFMRLQMRYITGLYPATITTETHRQALEMSGIPHREEDFAESLSGFTVIVLNGLQAVGQPGEATAAQVLPQ